MGKPDHRILSTAVMIPSHGTLQAIERHKPWSMIVDAPFLSWTFSTIGSTNGVVVDEIDDWECKSGPWMDVFDEWEIKMDVSDDWETENVSQSCKTSMRHTQ